MQLLSETIKDPKVLSLIRKYLQYGVMINGVIMETEKGIALPNPSKTQANNR